ncbi:MAG: hypothetical protein J7L25_05495 [Deltaproteobacteria bacterium]|nr:hypothetical protein [Candidatus Tharpella aukensis]
MANSVLKNINYQVGKLCRLGSRKTKLMAISNRRKQQLRHLGERVYIFKALQQDEDIWEKDEISQLLLTIADLDQEQEMIIDEINEIKAENPPEDISSDSQEKSEIPASEKAPAATTPEVKVKTPEPKKAPEVKKEVKKVAATVAAPAKTEEKPKPKTPRRRATTKKVAPKKPAPAKSDADK